MCMIITHDYLFNCCMSQSLFSVHTAMSHHCKYTTWSFGHSRLVQRLPAQLNLRQHVKSEIAYSNSKTTQKCKKSDKEVLKPQRISNVGMLVMQGQHFL